MFTGEDRSVELDGEAYFKVSKKVPQLFKVMTGDLVVTVEGTSFNLMAYEDEGIIVTTLVEGKVKVGIAEKLASGREAVHIVPGEQLVFDKEANTLESRPVDVSLYTSWKEGMFVFDHETLDMILRRLGRWYDFEAVYLATELRYYHFSGRLDRYESIEEILELLAMTTNISFEIKDNRVIEIDKQPKK
jgi:ferric-dicitrate binding protein FerR (iron transport regulator)